LPNKTIYVKDSDLPLWNTAQKKLGESISSLFVDYLRERIETKAWEKMDEIQAMNALLAEVNATLNLDIELHPFWRYPILDQNTLNHGFKLHQKRANPDRTMSLVIWPLDFDSVGQANPVMKERIKTAIQKFWDGKNTEMHTFIDTTK
jgi:hypothetical protein